MVEEHTNHPSSRGKSRRERVEHARSRDILDVANELHMELVRSGRDYRWKEHDSMVISPDKNMWNWFSRHQGGDVIALVQTMKEINFNQAIDYLNDGAFKEFATVDRVQESFNYYLKPYEQPFEAGRSYLKEQRGLSDETIDFFLEKGVLAQANAKINGSIEPVVVFKSFDFSGEIVGATLQGIEENWEKWPERGYAKNIVRNSDGITGIHVDIGQPNLLIFAESAIDLMSYYELNKANLQDVRLISMDGLKEGVIGRHLAQLQSELSGRPLRWNHDELAEGLQTAIDNNFFMDGKHADWITLAVDNDEAGRNFISSLREKGAVVTEALPDLQHGQEKMDWNDALKSSLSDQISKIDQPEIVEDYQNQVEELIADITQDDTAYYLWHDEELHNLGAGDSILEEFHGMLEDRKYPVAGVELYIEDSSNDGATGYLSLEGHVLDRDGILDYLSDQEFSDIEKVEFLTKLQANLPEIWDKVLNHYEDTFKVVVDKYELKTSDSPLIQNQDTESLASEQKTVTYDFVKQENEDLVKQLEARIKAGEISISFGTDMYFYDVFGNLGNSHPLKYINAKRLEVLAPLQPILASIDDKTVDLYKNKGTVEQDSLYQALKPHQRTLGVDISTRFIGELAIAAYSTNKQLESLSAEQFGAYYGTRTFDNLSQSIERMLEYPLNEAGIKDYTYGFVTTPNAFYHYLVEQEGKVVLNRSDVEMLMSRIESQSYQIVEPIQEEVAVSEAKEKSLEMIQETEGELVQQKNERTNGSLGSLQPEAEGSPTPVPLGTFERSVTSRPTLSSHLLYFTINEEFKSTNDGRYHAITANDLAKLNRTIRRQTIQNAAQYYLSELANSKIYYVTPHKTVQVNFEEKHFMHLTGIKPIAEGQTPEKTLYDFAEGNGHFDNILLANSDAAFDKINVLSDLSVATESTSFYFDDLTDIRRYNGRFDSLIKSDDKDIMLLFKELGEDSYIPISVFQSRTKIARELETIDRTPILGVYRERNGQIEQLSINEEYVKDGGQEMLSILENKLYEEALVPTQEIVNNDEISAELFTQILDTAYNVGDPRKLGTQVPEESKVAWERYYELSDSHEGNFGTVVEVADQMGLIDKDSNFYREWNQDRIYNENYHVRLQWSEDWEERGPQLPFNATDLIDYGAFAEELYRQNNSWRSRHVESIQEGSDVHISYTKVKFDVYAPGGTLIKDNVRYDIGDETEPISRLLGLGYRRLEGQPDLAAIDEKILSQLENQEVNLEIATEANEQSLKTQEILQDEANSHRESFQSPHQKMKTGLAQRIEEIMAEETAKNQVKEGEQDYTVKPDEPFDYTNASAYEISEHAFQKIREYTQSPEDLLEYMDFMSKFPQLSPRNVALIHEQWRGANAVATYDQWQAMGEALGVKPEDVIQTKATYTNKRTGETKEVVHQGLSVKTGEKSQITLFRPLMVKMIPVLDESGHQIKNDKGNPKFKKLSEATPQEKALVKDGKLPVRQFQERDPKTGYPRFTTYKVFELSQTTLKPESYPKAMPNRHYNFNVDKVKTKEVLEGLCDYAESLGVKMMKDEAHVLGNAKGAFYPGEQLILINPDNTPGEKIATTIHELAHATLHNPKLADQYKELPKGQKELEAEMTSHILSKHFGLDTSEKAINYMANWTGNLKTLDDKQLADSLKRVHKTVSSMMKQIENHTQPYQFGKSRGQGPNFPKPPTKGLSR
ncbi:toprim domain-containing protein [Streptococcus agalactiae]|uniref:PBECR4 domain-containing protein n=1 Tax=Streptococcus agalactiae TaxID=1311 RepID=UPI001C972C82|nr:PBECR4 domain-containing protein [Streptococcus agalactiae]MBY4835026.1 toprim domain-containing protein [Streptococcus agalactiae]MBY5053202.1 toprim domain-containing protein [Streptococcus agalactiae]